MSVRAHGEPYKAENAIRILERKWEYGKDTSLAGCLHPGTPNDHPGA